MSERRVHFRLEVLMSRADLVDTLVVSQWNVGSGRLPKLGTKQAVKLVSDTLSTIGGVRRPPGPRHAEITDWATESVDHAFGRLLA